MFKILKWFEKLKPQQAGIFINCLQNPQASLADGKYKIEVKDNFIVELSVGNKNLVNTKNIRG